MPSLPTTIDKLSPGRQRRRPLSLAPGLALVAALLLAACGPAAPPTGLPETGATDVPAPTALAVATEAPTALPTAAAAPTALPAATDVPTDAPTALPAATAVPTDAPTTLPASTLGPTTLPAATAGVSPTAAMDEAEVELEDFQFQPKELTVRVGTTVKFSNKDDALHTVTSDTNLFDSGELAKGEEFFYTFTEAGEYPYFCAPHGWPGGGGMSGTIIVVP